MPVAPLAVLAAEPVSSLPNHWLVGGVVLLLLVVCMGALLAFGHGRDHS